MSSNASCIYMYIYKYLALMNALSRNTNLCFGRRSWQSKGFRSSWLSLFSVQGREVVQLAGGLKVPVYMSISLAMLHAYICIYTST